MLPPALYRAAEKAADRASKDQGERVTLSAWIREAIRDKLAKEHGSRRRH